ncbi:hypothetical protein AAXE64_26970 [Priestia megaterium]
MKEFYKEVFKVIWNFIFLITGMVLASSVVVVIVSIAIKYIIKPVWIWGVYH